MKIDISIDTQSEDFDKSDTCTNLRRLANVFDADRTDTFIVAETRTTPLPKATVTESTPTVADNRVTEMFTSDSDPLDGVTSSDTPQPPYVPVTDTPTAQVPVVPTVNTPVGTAELDTNGLPWDERINAATRTKKADGTWKRKPRIDDELYNSVIAELKGDSQGVGVPPIAEDTPLPPGDDETINGQELFMEVIRFNMALNAGGLTNELAIRTGLENVNFLAQADQTTLAKYKGIFDQIKTMTDLAQAEAIVNMICPAQS